MSDIQGFDEPTQHTKTVTVISTDHVTFTLTMDEIKLSQMLTHACGGEDLQNYEISVSMPSTYLKMAVDYMKYHAIHPPRVIPEPPPHNDFKQLVDPFDYDLVNDIPTTELLHYHQVLSYLVIDSLESLLLQKAACVTVNCTPEEYCERLGIDVATLQTECAEPGVATWYEYVQENIKYDLK